MAKNRFTRIALTVLLSVAGLLAILIIAFEILLRPSVLTGLVNKYAPQYIEGNVEFSEIRARIVKSFPFASIEAKDFAITYPHERYARFDTLYPEERTRRFSLMKAGCARDSSGIDTLVSLKRLYAAVNYMSLLKGQVNIHALELDKPRIFAHVFDSTASNWDIFPMGESSPEDTTSTGGTPLDLELHRICFSGKPVIVYTNPVDTTHLMVRMKGMELSGKLRSTELWKTHAGFGIDSMFISGRLPADTLALALHNLDISAARRRIKLDANAVAFLWTDGFGRVKFPIHLDADATMPARLDNALEADIHSLNLGLSALSIGAKGKILSHENGTDLNLDAVIDECPLGEIMHQYRENISFFKKVTTDATASLNAHIEGTLGEGQVPAITARLQIPEADVDIKGMGRSGRLALDADLLTDDLSQIDASIHKLEADIAGARINLSGNAWDILGDNPVMALDGSFRARMDSVANIFLDDIYADGSLRGRVHGKARLSQLNLRDIGDADIDCSLSGQNLAVSMQEDSVRAYFRNIDLDLSTRGNKIDRSIPAGARVLGLKAVIDTLNASYGGNVYARGSDVFLIAQNSADILKGGKKLSPLMGILTVGRMSMKDLDGIEMAMKGNKETFRIYPPSKPGGSPVIKLTTESEGIATIMEGNSFAMKGMNAKIEARQHVKPKRNKARRNHLLDSLQRVYPGIPRDSLFRHARMERMARELQDDFAKADVMLSMSKSSQEMARTWDFEGKLGLDLVRAYLDGFPLTADVTDVKGRFTNDRVELENLTLTAGESDLSAKADVSGIRRLLTGRGKPFIKADASITSGFINVNELMDAYGAYVSESGATNESASSDASTEGSQLLVLPSNVDARLSLESSGIQFDSLNISWAAADIALRERTLQITNGLAASNMGDLYVEGFYATRSKDDIKAGFDLNIVDISAEKVLTLMPDVKKDMPLMNSFSGDLDMEIAATTEIDTAMNVVLPTLDGIMRFSGSQLALKDSKEFTKIAKLLLFKDKSQAVIDNMSVTGMIRSNTLEVFPFVLDVDRYMMAASGVQNLDESFNYHISVIRSPLVVKFGLNAWGKDFDHIRYGLGRARYTSPNVPAFTRQLDTVQYNLVAAIHNVYELGVEKAVAEHNGQSFIQDSKDRASFREFADTVAMDDVIMAKIESMEGLSGSVVERVAARREQLRGELLALEKQYALKPEETTPSLKGLSR